jgi:alpha-ketoglutarate-dependent taurine dioxygenase
MKLTPIPNFANRGIYIDDLDFNNLSVDEWVDLKTRLYSKYLLIIFRNANLPLTDYASRIAQWGTPSFAFKYFLRKYDISAKEYFSETCNDLRKLYNLAQKHNISFDDLDIIEKAAEKVSKISDHNLVIVKLIGKSETENKIKKSVILDGELAWHQDESMDIAFSDVISLYGNQSMTKSATGFVTTNKWYEDQSESFRSELDSMIATHTYKPTMFNKNLDPVEKRLIECSTGFDNEIPLVINSPGGFKGLHYPLNTITGIVGMTDTESRSLFDYINKTLFVQEHMYDHWYQQDNDLIIFDNSITSHRRLGSTSNRVAYRTTFYFQDLLVDRYIQQDYQEKYRSIMSKYN